MRPENSATPQRIKTRNRRISLLARLGLHMKDIFRRYSSRVSGIVGSGWAFMSALGLIVGSGLYFSFSESWKTNVNFVSTLIVLLLLFVLQKSQNHSDKATHLKLDELVRAVEGARDEIVSAEEQSAVDMDDLKQGK